ncbi:MAG: hypothetical protein ACRD4O_05645 [Bryobacteraceae bacterium]
MTFGEDFVEAFFLLFVQDFEDALAAHLGDIVPLIFDVLIIFAIIVQNLRDGAFLWLGQVELGFEVLEAEALGLLNGVLLGRGEHPRMQIGPRDGCADGRAAQENNRQNGEHSGVGPFGVRVTRGLAPV